MTADEERFASLLAAHGRGLSRVVASYAKPRDQDDLGQDIALAIWRALPSFRGESSERTFVYRIAHNRGLSYVARRRIEGAVDEELVDRAPNPESHAQGREGVERLFAAIRALPVAHRQVLTLALEDLSHEEIATCLGITADHVAVRLHRARAALRKELEEP